MGDTIELTTWPKHQHLFYLVTGSAFTFDVKAAANAAVGLAREPTSCDFWVCYLHYLPRSESQLRQIAIGENDGHSWIKSADQDAKIVFTPNILSPNCYSKFWLTWYGGTIRLGRSGFPTPLVTFKHKVPDLKYITFAALKQSNVVQWRFISSPVMLKPVKDIKIQDGQLKWVAIDNAPCRSLPEDAFVAGHEFEPLYVARSLFNNSLCPGKYMHSKRAAYLPWGGRAHETHYFMQILTGYNAKWVKTKKNCIPDNAFVAGFSEVRGEPLYIGRAMHDGHLLVGKVHCLYGTCYLPYQGAEVEVYSYEVLVNGNVENRSLQYSERT